MIEFEKVAMFTDNIRESRYKTAVIQVQVCDEKCKDFSKARAHLQRVAEGFARSDSYHKIQQTIESTIWEGPKRNWTFDDYIAKLDKAFRDLEEMGRPNPEFYKVSILLRNILHSRFEVAIIQVEMCDEMSKDFPKACAYLQRFAERTIHSVDSSSKNSNRGKQKPFKGKIQAKRYPPKVYKRFTKQQRNELQRLRNAKSTEAAANKIK